MFLMSEVPLHQRCRPQILVADRPREQQGCEDAREQRLPALGGQRAPLLSVHLMSQGVSVWVQRVQEYNFHEFTGERERDRARERARHLALTQGRHAGRLLPEEECQRLPRGGCGSGLSVEGSLPIGGWGSGLRVEG